MSIDDLIYKKDALGKSSKNIIVYKIKTMYDGADVYWDTIANESGLDWMGKPNNDPRIIPSRAFLRKYWIDEVPQLYNLLRGEMTFVGIRPRDEREWDKLYSQEFKKRALEFRPGLFGVRYAKKFKSEREAAGFEMDYIAQKEKHPILTDIKFLAKIIYNIVFDRMRSV